MSVQQALPGQGKTEAVAEVAYIALGSNLADPAAQVRAGFEALARLPATRVTARSSLYRTAPVGYLDQPDFINAVAGVRTRLAPRALLEALLAVERAAGRVRDPAQPNAPRVLDLDVILYGDRVLHEAGLSVPHPRLHERAFVLAPLAEIAPEVQVPGRGRARDLLAAVGSGGVQRLAAAHA